MAESWFADPRYDAGLARLEQLDRVQAVAHAEQAELLADLASRTTRGWDHGDAYDTLLLEVAGTLRIGQVSAGSRLADAQHLTTGLPGTLAGLRDGSCGVAQARVIVGETRDCDPAVCLVVEARLLPAGGSLAPGELRRRVRTEVLRADAEAAARRAARARVGRRVWARQAAEDGMAVLFALVPQVQAQLVVLSLTEQARALKTAGDPRTVDQLRADLLCELLTGQRVAPPVVVPPGRPDLAGQPPLPGSAPDAGPESGPGPVCGADEPDWLEHYWSRLQADGAPDLDGDPDSGTDCDGAPDLASAPDLNSDPDLGPPSRPGAARDASPEPAAARHPAAPAAGAEPALLAGAAEDALGCCCAAGGAVSCVCGPVAPRTGSAVRPSSPPTSPPCAPAPPTLPLPRSSPDPGPAAGDPPAAPLVDLRPVVAVRPPQVVVLVPLATALGVSDAPGQLVGVGPLCAAEVRELMVTAELRALFVDEATGIPLSDLSRPLAVPAPAAASGATGAGGRARRSRRSRAASQRPVPASHSAAGAAPAGDGAASGADSGAAASAAPAPAPSQGPAAAPAPAAPAAAAPAAADAPQDSRAGGGGTRAARTLALSRTPEQLRLLLRELTLAPVALPPDVPEAQHDPSAALARRVRLRDQTCDGIGCSVSAERSELDHHIAWPAGPTSAGNLRARSQRCHHAKHHGWTVLTVGGGGTSWISPAGRTYRVPSRWTPPPCPVRRLPAPAALGDRDADLLTPVPDPDGERWTRSRW